MYKFDYISRKIKFFKVWNEAYFIHLRVRQYLKSAQDIICFTSAAFINLIIHVGVVWFLILLSCKYNIAISEFQKLMFTTIYKHKFSSESQYEKWNILSTKMIIIAYKCYELEFELSSDKNLSSYIIIFIIRWRRLIYWGTTTYIA